MKQLRPATIEEIESIKEESNLTQTSQVVALDTPLGPILYVVRQAVELDPVHMPKGSNAHHFGAALRDISNWFLGGGVTTFFFNLHCEDADGEYGEFMEKWGCDRLSKKPIYRYRKDILSQPA